ncbi:MAG: molybdopterin converting factor [Flavobacteriaceae bacterium]|nr:molybdopterin converting factor [Flavobacteriaceae bacterium]|tara:strand:+ start:129 stop:557 length:429 start_codon:yes stop_codon:yes gene_type:complete
MKNFFLNGPISPDFISNSIYKHQIKHNIGAHNIFLGQVRKDTIKSNVVSAIEYSAYEEMANKKITDIRESTFEKFDLTCLHIYHSLGVVEVGQIGFFVFVSSSRRKNVYDATKFIVDMIKNTVPIFGKEIFENNEYNWKVNK